LRQVLKTLALYPHSISVLMPVGSHELDPDVPIPFILPGHKQSRPLTAHGLIYEWLARIVTLVLRCAE